METQTQQRGGHQTNNETSTQQNKQHNKEGEEILTPFIVLRKS
jgi:hypothetical protein